MQGNLKTKGKHARRLLELGAANYNIDYTPGTENGAADCLRNEKNGGGSGPPMQNVLTKQTREITN